MTVMTPGSPFRNCAEQVGPGFRDLLARELYEAWETVETAALKGADPWPELVSPPPLHRRHAAWVVVTIRAAGTGEFDETPGRVRGRMRALLTALEEAGAADAHAWPRPFDVGPASAHFAVGLGRTPPNANELAAITAGWVKGLTGVTVEAVECGAVPTLR
jgi:poly(A) polymerase Pap1